MYLSLFITGGFSNEDMGKKGKNSWVDKISNKKHFKNFGPICHCEPPHAHSPGVATVARCLRIDVHNDNAWRDRYGPIEWAQ